MPQKKAKTSQPPKRNTVPGPAPAQEEVVETVEDRIPRYSALLRRAIRDLRENVDAPTSALLSDFLPLISPTYHDDPQPAFPIPYKPHPRNRERAGTGGARYLVCYHVAHAVKLLYETVKWPSAANEQELAVNLEFLQTLVNNLDKFYQHGDDAHGYYLGRQQ